jgi:pimeloyl-ACP methyl ester carboxylesterase
MPLTSGADRLGGDMMATRARRWILRGLLGLIVLLAIALAAGTVWETSVRAGLPERYPPPGQMVDVGTHRLHLRRFGQGPVTVVLEAGSGNSGSLNWLLIEKELARFATVVAYDRAGVNWSEPGPEPRTSARIADELHAALQALGVTGPLVLVGHSQGGVHMMQYALAHRSQVTGLVLLDSPLPNSSEEMPAEAKAMMLPGPAQQVLLKTMIRTGVMRLTMPPGGGGFPDTIPGVNTDSVNAVLTAFFPSGMQYSVFPEFDGMTGAAAVPFERHLLDSLPVRALSSPYLPPREALGPGWSDSLYDDVIRWWATTQSRLTELSTRAEQYTVPNSHHGIQFSNPDVVVETIRSLVIAAEPPVSR